MCVESPETLIDQPAEFGRLGAVCCDGVENIVESTGQKLADHPRCQWFVTNVLFPDVYKSIIGFGNEAYILISRSVVMERHQCLQKSHLECPVARQ